MHHAHEVCKTTFGFLYGVGRWWIMSLKESYLWNGLETCIHGNTKGLPHNQMTHRAICNVVKFLQNYAQQNAILLPGRLPNYKKDDIKLLPSSCSKKVFLSLLVVNSWDYKNLTFSYQLDYTSNYFNVNSLIKFTKFGNNMTFVQ